MTSSTIKTGAPTGTERLPPYDLDAEMALLGSMMMSRDAISEVVPIIGRSDSGWFYVPAHQKLFEVLLDLYDDPVKAIDLIVVSDELRRRELLEFVGGHAYMVRLAESFAEWTNAEHYAHIVRDKGLLRDLIRTTHEIAEEAYSGLADPKELLDLAEQRLFAVTQKRVGGSTVLIREVVEKLRRQLEEGTGALCTGLPTGFPRLDELTSGFQPGDMIILAGRPSMGKTALGLTMAYHAAVRDKVRRPLVFFSMEMGRDQLAQRLIAIHSNIDAQKLRRRLLSEVEQRELLYACDEFTRAPLYIDDTPGMTAMELRAKTRRLHQQHDIQAVFVDYLQLMHTPRAENRQVEIAQISRSLKGLARELEIPVIALSQLNRMPEGRHDKRPMMSDLRESGAIEQDADMVLLIHRDEYYHPEKEEAKGLAELIIAKQRNGPVDTVQLTFDRKRTVFRPFSPEPDRVPLGADAVPF